jgi:hypothetical protein
MAMTANFYNLTSFNHKFIEDKEVTVESGITTKSDTWPEITYEFINFLRACGFHPNREDFEDVLDQYFGAEGCDNCDCEPEF